MKGGEQGDDLADDVVGVASARLLAAGVPAARRRQALRLLGVLESVAGPDLLVRRPVRDVAVEFGLPPHEVEGWLDDLAEVGVVERWGDVIELAAVEPPAPGALRLQDFLALADEPSAEPETVVPLRRATRPAVGVLAAAALLVVAILAGALPQDDERSPVAATGVNATSTTAASSPDPSFTSTSGWSRSSTTIGGATASTVTTTGTTVAPPPQACESDQPPVVELLDTVPEGGTDLRVGGVVRNTGDTGAAVRSIVVQGVQLPVDLVVPAGGSAPWSATLSALGLPATLSAGLGDWDWVPPIPEGCLPS